MSQRLNLMTASEDATAPVADPAQVALAEQARALAEAVTAYVGTAADGNTVVNAAFEGETSLVIVVHVKPGGRLHPREAIKVFREVLGQGLQAVYVIQPPPPGVVATGARAVAAGAIGERDDMNHAPLNPSNQGQGLITEQARDIARARPLSGSANAKTDPSPELRVHAEIRLLELRIAGAYEVVQQLTQRLESAGVLRANPPATAENRATGVHADVPMAAHLAGMSVFAAATGLAIQDVLDRLEI